MNTSSLVTSKLVSIHTTLSLDLKEDRSFFRLLCILFPWGFMPLCIPSLYCKCLFFKIIWKYGTERTQPLHKTDTHPFGCISHGNIGSASEQRCMAGTPEPATPSIASQSLGGIGPTRRWEKNKSGLHSWEIKKTQDNLFNAFGFNTCGCLHLPLQRQICTDSSWLWGDTGKYKGS